MKRSHAAVTLAAVTALLASACSNPTVDPSSTFTVRGTALNAEGQPLASADVRLVRFFDPAKLLQPTIDDLFACDSDDCGYQDLDVEAGLVATQKTDAQGVFSFSVKGADIAAEGGITDAQGKVEVSNLVVIVVDPADPSRRAGVLSFDHLFQQTDKEWGVGTMQLLDSTATADVQSAATSGLVHFTWGKLTRDTSATVKTLYRLDVSGTSSARLVVRCREGTEQVEGGCADADAGRLTTSISAYSIYSFYSDNGDFSAYLTTTGVDFRYRSRFTVPAPVADPRGNRDPVGFDGIWAVTAEMNQSLFFDPAGPAHDGNLQTRATINNNAKEIYVKFSQPTPTITDAGLLNSVAKDADRACVTVEFTTNDFVDVDAAKRSNMNWEKAGKFCGSVGAPNEMAAVISYDTSSSNGKIAAWMRYKIIADANEDPGASPHFVSVGEVAVYQKKQ